MTSPTPASVGTAVSAASVDVERADEEFRAWMRGHLARAAAGFGLVVTGTPVFGWYLRSISAPAHGADGLYWLRVGTERDRDLADPFMAAFWTGIADADAITGVAKPRVLHSMEWDEPEHQRRVRADAMTLLPGRPASDTDALHTPLDLPDSWWSELRASLDAIAAFPTTRFAEHHQVGGRVRAVFGDRIATTMHPRRWQTVHGDLHWNNVLAPQLGLLDWEFWGSGPAGHDAATLYLFSLLTPDTARRVHEVFADVLDTPDGQRAQIGVASRILYRAQRGDYPALADAVRRHIPPLVDTQRIG